MGNATAASDYSFNTYFDVIFYLIAALLIIKNRNCLWFIPLSIVAAFNRETAILIPAMLFLASLKREGKGVAVANKGNLWMSVLSGVAFMAVFFGLRQYYGYRETQVVGIAPGLDALWFNISDLRTYVELFAVTGLLPVLAIVGYKYMDARLKTWFWLIVPVWFAMHYYFAAVREARLFLVPVMVVFLPAVLLFVQRKILAQR
jgi:hypothetical protein